MSNKKALVRGPWGRSSLLLGDRVAAGVGPGDRCDTGTVDIFEDRVPADG